MEDWKTYKDIKEKNIGLIKTNRNYRCILCHNRIGTNNYAMVFMTPKKGESYLPRVACHVECIGALKDKIQEEYEDKISQKV